MENKSMRLLYDEKRGGIVSLTSKLDGNQTEFVLTPEEFPEYDAEDGKWLGSVEGTVAVDGREISFQSGDVRKNSRLLIRRGTAAQESGSRCKAVQEPGSRCKATQESGSQNQAAQESGSWYQAAQEPGSRNQATQEPGSRYQAAQESGSRNQAAQEPGSWYQAAQEPGSRNQAAQEPGSQNQMTQNPGAKEQAEQDTILVECPEIRCGGIGTGVSLEMAFAFQGEALDWEIALKNKSHSDVLIKNLNLPLLMNQYFRNDDSFKYDRCVMRHTCITGHSSYLYWEKSSGNGPVLLMMPLGDSMFLDLTKEGDGLFGGRFGESFAYEGMVRVHLVSEKPVYAGPDKEAGPERGPESAESGQCHKPGSAENGPGREPESAENGQCHEPESAENGQYHKPGSMESGPGREPGRTESGQCHEPGSAENGQCHEPGSMGNAVLLKPEESAEFRIALVFLENEKQIPEALAARSLTVLKAVPGMVGPIENDFHVMTQPVDAVVELCSSEDQILDTAVKNGWRVSRIRFGACGRRYVRVQNRGNYAYYCFFGTESPREMIDGHAAFIAEKHLEQDESDPCYHALLMWDMGNKRRINAAFNPYTEDWWRGGSDDPGLASGLFLSEKNVYRPVEGELAVLHAFVEDFVLTRLTEQPGWRVHRMVPWFTMFEPWAGNGADDVWRAYNYIHVINIMRNMYLIKKQYQVPYFRKAVEYLKMAYEYTRAMFHYWMYPRGAGAWEFGNMGEMTLPLCLAQELQEEGLTREAEEINGIMDKKAQYFASREYPFGSEMPYDSTAFEAVYAYGKRMGDNRVMGSAARASFANRGKQPVWFLYNTDLRGGGDTGWNSSYMTQLGACPILDYCLEEGHIDEDWVLAFYGAWLSGWLLYNSGGYWNADPENRGATGWITIASRINHSDPKPAGISDTGEKAGMPLSKGCVTLSGEAGIGYFGALRSACSIVMDHSVLGRIGLGCDTGMQEGAETIIPRDGLSMRLYHIPERWKIQAAGGFLHRVRLMADTLEIEVVPRAKKGMRLEIMSIPETGEKQRLLYKLGFAGSCGEGHTIRIDRAALKNRREDISK